MVLETTRRPEYALSYPSGQLVIKMQARNNAIPQMIEGTMVNSISLAENKIIVNLRQSIQPIPSSQIMVLPPMNGNNYRLVLGFGGTGVAATTSTATRAAAVQSSGNNVANLIAANRKPVIVIDPGHGGRDPGAIGVSGAREKDIKKQSVRIV